MLRDHGQARRVTEENLNSIFRRTAMCAYKRNYLRKAGVQCSVVWRHRATSTRVGSGPVERPSQSTVLRINYSIRNQANLAVQPIYALPGSVVRRSVGCMPSRKLAAEIACNCCMGIQHDKRPRHVRPAMFCVPVLRNFWGRQQDRRVGSSGSWHGNPAPNSRKNAPRVLPNVSCTYTIPQQCFEWVHDACSCNHARMSETSPGWCEIRPSLGFKTKVSGCDFVEATHVISSLHKMCPAT